MNDSLKAVVLQLSGGNIRNHHIDLRGSLGLFPDDCLGGSNISGAGQTIRVRFGSDNVETDIDEAKAIFRERSAVRKFFEAENLQDGDLVLIERVEERSFRVSKASKRGFNQYL